MKKSGMRTLGRKPWWRKIWTTKGVRDMTEAEDSAIKQRAIEQHDGNAEWIASLKEWSRTEKLARLASPAFADLRRQRIRGRDNVKARNVRIYGIAKEISARGWLGKSNSWIAMKLAGCSGRSVNTIRADVATAKKFLMGSQNPKN